jgi:hypothetical protein
MAAVVVGSRLGAAGQTYAIQQARPWGTQLALPGARVRSLNV